MSSKFKEDKNLKATFEFEIQGRTQNTAPLTSDPVRTQLVVDHIPLIKCITTQISSRLPTHVDRMDLLSAGMIGLIDAIEKYDPSRDNKFKTYAEFRIRGAILDELRNQDWLPRSAREIHKKDKQAQIKLEQKFGRQPTATEMAEFLNVSIEEYQAQVARINISLVSLDELSENKQYVEKISLNEFDSHAKQDPLHFLTVKSTQSAITKALSELKYKQRLVLEMYYYNDLSLKEIGQLFSLTESRVSQLHTSAIEKMKKKLKDLLTE